MPFDQQSYTPADAILSALVTARRLIDDPQKWWQCGRTHGYKQHCLLTAAGYGWMECTGEWPPGDSHPALQYLMAATPAPTVPAIANFNDAATTTHADVLAVMDRAIAARRADLLAETGARS